MKCSVSRTFTLQCYGDIPEHPLVADVNRHTACGTVPRPPSQNLYYKLSGLAAVMLVPAGLLVALHLAYKPGKVIGAKVTVKKSLLAAPRQGEVIRERGVSICGAFVHVL